MANRATNGSISDSRTSTDGHRTPNTDNLSKTNLYIRGLATNTTDEVLYNLCAPFGNITSTRAIMDKLTGNCKGMRPSIFFHSPLQIFLIQAYPFSN